MPADPDLLDAVYTFAKARAVERVDRAARKGAGREHTVLLRERVRLLQEYYGMAKAHPTNEAIAAAIDVCRKAAMQDHTHPDYDPVWTLPTG